MPLPAGYTLDKPGKGASATPAPKLPPGYILDSTPSEVATAASSAPVDFTSNPQGEGLYRMAAPAGGESGRFTGGEVQVPFSQVQAAQSAGYSLHPDEAPRYQKDASHIGKGPTTYERVKSLLSRMTEPMPDQPLTGSAWQQANAAMGNVERLPLNLINRTVRGVAGLPAGVVQTARGISRGDPAALESLNPATMGESASRGLTQDTSTLGPMAAFANLGGDVTTAYLTGKLGSKVADTGIRTAEGAVEAAQSTIRRLAGSGPGVARELVRKATEENQQTALSNTTKLAKAERQWRDDQIKAISDHQAELLRLKQKYAKDVRDAEAEAQTGPTGQNYWTKRKAAKQEYQQAVRDQVQKYETERAAAEKANAEALRQHNQSIGKRVQRNRAITAAEQAKSDQTTRLQVNGSRLITGLRQLDKALNARAAVMFDTVRDLIAKSKQPPLPGTELGAAARAALTKITGSTELPKPFRDILGKYPEAEPEAIEYKGAQIPKGHPLYDVLAQNGAISSPLVTFADLQGYYTETGAELAKGTLAGDVFTATKELHNTIGDMMQKMAKAAGPEANKMFWDSRIFYRNYMDIFHEYSGPSASGSPVAQALLAEDPLVAVDKFSGKSGNRGIADLGRYSNSLANLAQETRHTAQVKIKIPARKSITDLPQPEIKPIPSMEATPPPSKPLPVELDRPPVPHLPLPPVMPNEPSVPFPKVEFDPRRTISAEDLQRANETSVLRRGSGAVGSLIRLSVVWPAFHMLSDLIRGRAVSPGGLAAVPAAGATGMAIEELLAHPQVHEFLTRATRQQVAQIPLELRGEMPEIVEAARSRRIPVSPILAAWAATVQRNRGSRQPSQPSPPSQPTGAPQ